MRVTPCFAASFGVLVLVMAAALPSCATLESIPLDQCGNRVLDSGEDCDTDVNAKRFGKGDQGLCGTPDDGPAACHYVCGQHPVEGGVVSAICPSNEVCSLDDSICRRDPLTLAPPGSVAQYQFQPLGTPILDHAQSLVTGDFDGDGIDDVVAAADDGTRVYLGSSKGLSLSFSTELATSGARAGLLTGTLPTPAPRDGLQPPAPGFDSTSDLAFVLDGGIGVLTGEVGGTLTPAAYAKVESPVNFFFAGFVLGRGKSSDPPLSTSWLLLPYDKKQQVPNGSNCAIQSGMPPPLSFGYIGEVPTAVHCFPGMDVSQVSNVVLAPITPSPTQPCPQFAMAFRHASTVAVYAPCTDSDPKAIFTSWTLGVTATDVTIPGTILWGPLVYDVDGDGNLDIVVGTDDHEIDVAYGTGAMPASFSSQPGGLVDNHASPYSTSVVRWPLDPKPAVGAITDEVLAIGDLNGDHRPDLVTPSGIYMSVASSPADATKYFRIYAPDVGFAIDSAAFGDFNGDGLPDVALTHKDTDHGVGLAEVTVLLASAEQVEGVPLVNPFVVPLDGAGFHVVSGDFNGDGIDDVGLGQTTDLELHPNNVAKKGSIDTITIVYGDAGGNFTPVSMGQVTDITGMLSTNILLPDQEFYDGLADLGVVFTASSTEFAAAVLAGRTGRLMVAPLGLSRIEMGQKAATGLALATAPGKFLSTSHASIAALAVKADAAGKGLDELEVWLAPLEGPAAQSDQPSHIDLGAKVSDFAGKDSDPTDITTAATAAALDGSLDWFITAVAGQNGASLFFIPGASGQVRKLDLDWTSSSLAPVRVEAAKIGQSDAAIVVHVGGSIFYIPDPLHATGRVSPVADLDGVTDIAILPRPWGGNALIAFARSLSETSAGLYLMDDRLEPYQVNPVELKSVTALAVADVDGDRLPDLVVSSGATISVFQMLPTPAIK